MAEQSYASIYRLAVRESLRQELAAHLERIYTATHVAAGRARLTDTKDTVYCYGTMPECAAFADGLRRVTVRAITEQEQYDLARSKRAIFKRQGA